MPTDFKVLRDLKYDLAIDLFRQKARELSSRSRGLERYLTSLFDSNIMASIGLALDPYWQLSSKLGDVNPLNKAVLPLLSTVLPAKVIPANRYAERTAIPGQPVRIHTHSVGKSWTTAFTFTGSSWVARRVDNPDIVTDLISTPGVQQPVVMSRSDTTFKSRNPQVLSPKSVDTSRLNHQGEFELFKPSFDASDGGIHYLAGDTRGENIEHGQPSHSDDQTTKSSSYLGPNATVTRADVSALQSSQQTLALQLMTDNVDTLFARCLPSKRAFNGFYQIAELKDLPETFRATAKLWFEVEKLMGSDVFRLAQQNPGLWKPNFIQRVQASLGRVAVHLDPKQTAADAYLTFKFGWQSFVQAAEQLVSKPALITKQVNYLVERNGLDTTLSSEINFQMKAATVPAITVYPSIWETVDTTDPGSVSGLLNVKVRCVVNSGIKLPKIDPPRLKSTLWWDKLGVYPRPSDILNLIPFTWLVDWFVGLSDYTRIIEQVQMDDSLINWGVISCHLDGTYTGTLHCYTNTIRTWNFGSPIVSTSETVRNNWRHSARLYTKYIVRKDVQSVINSKTYSGKGLSATQNSILGALFTKYGKL